MRRCLDILTNPGLTAEDKATAVWLVLGGTASTKAIMQTMQVGRDKAREILSNLTRAGIITPVKTRQDRGRFAVPEYRTSPGPENQEMVASPEPENQGLRAPEPEKPGPVNQALVAPGPENQVSDQAVEIPEDWDSWDAPPTRVSAPARDTTTISTDTPESMNQKLEKGEKGGAGGKRGSRLPDDWQPTPADWRFARERGLGDASIRDQVERFTDYWRAKPGKDGVKLDWSATWRTWVRNAVQWADKRKQAREDRYYTDGPNRGREKARGRFFIP